MKILETFMERIHYELAENKKLGLWKDLYRKELKQWTWNSYF